jgi:hypothetical protein
MPSQAIAKRQEPGAIAMTDAVDYAIMTTDPEELRSAIQAATNGQRIDAFQLDMVKVPSGGVTMWTIPDIIEGERFDKTIQGIVVLQRTIRSWWKLGFDERGGAGTQPPDCSSQDGIWGVGHPDGHPDLVDTDAPEFAYEAFDANGNALSGPKTPTRYACEACPLAQFGSGKNQRGQACRQNRLVFLLTQDSALPIVIKVPPSSLKLVQGFLLRLSGKAIPPHGAVLAFSLRKTQNSGASTTRRSFPSSSLASMRPPSSASWRRLRR